MSVTIQLNSVKSQKNGELGTVPMIHNIFEFALERNHINKSKLLRYASRRNRREKVEQILHEIDWHDMGLVPVISIVLRRFILSFVVFYGTKIQTIFGTSKFSSIKKPHRP